MLTEGAIEIKAPASVVWDVFTDVERWPDWTASVRRLSRLDGDGLAVGQRFRIEQPRMPKLVWTVTAVSPGASWTWANTAPGNRTSATHEVIDLGDGRTRVRQVIDQAGPLGALVGLLMRSMTRRYLDLEAEGLKATSEARARAATA
jgi:uncharacterized membrane protein